MSDSGGQMSCCECERDDCDYVGCRCRCHGGKRADPTREPVDARLQDAKDKLARLHVNLLRLLPEHAHALFDELLCPAIESICAVQVDAATVRRHAFDEARAMATATADLVVSNTEMAPRLVKSEALFAANVLREFARSLEVLRDAPETPPATGRGEEK